MSQGQNATASTVLLIEADPSLRRLISLGLQHQGLQVIESSCLAKVASADVPTLDLLILDVDGAATRDRADLEMLHENPYFAFLPTVVLSWEHLSSVNEDQAPQLVCLPKPFDARSLHATVGNLLGARAAQEAVRQAQAEEFLLASYRQKTAPSIWPVITAAGLLLAVIGLLMQLALVVVGLLIVMVALLVWNLGTRSQPVESGLLVRKMPLPA